MSTITFRPFNSEHFRADCEAVGISVDRLAGATWLIKTPRLDILFYPYSARVRARVTIVKTGKHYELYGNIEASTIIELALGTITPEEIISGRK